MRLSRPASITPVSAEYDTSRCKSPVFDFGQGPKARTLALGSGRGRERPWHTVDGVLVPGSQHECLDASARFQAWKAQVPVHPQLRVAPTQLPERWDPLWTRPSLFADSNRRCVLCAFCLSSSPLLSTTTTLIFCACSYSCQSKTGSRGKRTPIVVCSRAHRAQSSPAISGQNIAGPVHPGASSHGQGHM